MGRRARGGRRPGRLMEREPGRPRRPAERGFWYNRTEGRVAAVGQTRRDPGKLPHERVPMRPGFAAASTRKEQQRE